MSLHSDLMRQVRFDIVSAGQKLALESKVILESNASQSAKFLVKGDQNYNVEIFWLQCVNSSDGLVEGQCECEESLFSEDFCEHCVAAVLFLKNRMPSFQRFLGSRKSLTFMNSSDDRDDSGEFDDDVIEDRVSDVFRSYPSKTVIQKPSRISELLRATEPSQSLVKSWAELAKPKEYAPIEVWYELVGNGSSRDSFMEIRLRQRSVLAASGRVSARKSFGCPISPEEFHKLQFVHSDDLNILRHYASLKSALAGRSRYSWPSNQEQFKALTFKDGWDLSRLEEFAKTGRCYFEVFQGVGEGFAKDQNSDIQIIEAKTEVPLQWWFVVKPGHGLGLYTLSCELRSPEGERFDPRTAFWTDLKSILITRCGELRQASILAPKLTVFVRTIILDGNMTAEIGELEPLLHRIIEIPGSHHLEAPDELMPSVNSPALKPRLGILRTPAEFSPDHIYLNITMIYGSRHFELHDDVLGWNEMVEGKAVRHVRNIHEEQRVVAEFVEQVPFMRRELGHGGRLAYHATVLREDLIDLVHAAVKLGWRVDYEGRAVKVATDFKMGISSGIDWFNVSCEASFDGQVLRGMQLLSAKALDSGFITLADGSLGLVKDQGFLKNLKVLRRISKEDRDASVKISKFESLLLELEGLAAESCERDADAAAFFERVQSFKSIEPVKAPKGFVGDLRPYQGEGISWLNYLNQTGFGGILADDMGLGKTVQVIAHLAAVHAQKKSRQRKISIVIAPKSVLYNWKKEFQRFAPALRVGVLSSGEGSLALDDIDSVDVLIASYHLARSQIKALGDREFEYVVLDEAHAIKNRSAQVTRSVKLLRARHRLALTGTPIENSLDNLASIFEFLNPGLGSTNVFSKVGTGLDASADELKELAAAIRPFMLRRTKQQVLTDLPPKTETVLYCDLSEEERREYDSLAVAIKKNLEEEIEKNGIKKSQIHILAALTKLRQAACNLSLVDKSLESEISTKFAVMLDRIRELASEGEKCLVFSQFTEHLKLAKKALEAHGIFYSYLDGQTNDREKVIQEFNSKPQISVFLLSLKAGGVGLNLTSATNCFILDPWWNPAAESQAIDRAYRIGQTKPVFAYRIISRNTVEEKILQLQGMKSDLSSAVLEGGEGAPRALTRDDLNTLLQ